MSRITRRRFLQSGLWLAGGAVVPPLGAPATRAEAASQTVGLPGTLFRPRATDRSNPIVVENQQPGHADWRPTRYQYDILGYASATSVSAGERLDFHVDTSAAVFDLHLYRLGYYGGAGGRRVAEFNGLPGTLQPEPWRDPGTGLASCANWSVSHSLVIPAEWVSGIYLAKLTRRDTGGEGAIVFAVRDESRAAELLCQQPVTTYHAYNNYGGKSLYSHISDECATVSGAPRAVKVSLNRPYNAPLEDQSQLLRVDFPLLYWLEAQGYDLSYCTNLDVHGWGQPGAHNRLLAHRAFVSMGHDEYWSQSMRAAVTAAREAGVHLFISGANCSYWRIRLEPDPVSGQPDRTIVCYKNTEGGPPDPSGEPTGTWRDALGANDPEAALLGVQYIGDNDSAFFPLRFDADRARDRAFRYTGLQELPDGTFVDVGRELVGWEWDAAPAPESVTVLAASPVYGALLTDDGDSKKRLTRGAQAHTARSIAPSGAHVFATGTLQWSWALALREPDRRVQQITCNVLADMGLLPATPDEALRLDADPPTESERATPTPAASDAPAIVIAGLDPTDTGFSVRWEADREVHVQAWLGDSAEFVNEVANVPPPLSRSGQIGIDGLQPGRAYFVRLAAWARADAVGTSQIQSVRTLPLSSADGAKQIVSDFLTPARCTARPAMSWARANRRLTLGLGSAAVAGMGALVWAWGRRWRARRNTIRAAITPQPARERMG